MKVLKCGHCQKDFEASRHNSKYCSAQCQWKINDMRRKMYGRVMPDEVRIYDKPKVKIYGVTNFDWRDYPYGTIV